MKTLKFAEHFVPLIISGKKTSTWRLFDDKNLQIGDRIILMNQKTEEEFAKADIIGIKEKKLGEIEDSDFKGHERFESTMKMYQMYQSYYGNSVSENTLVKMIDFKLIL